MPYEDENFYKGGHLPEDSKIETRDILENEVQNIYPDPILEQYDRKLVALTTREIELQKYVSLHQINPLQDEEVINAKKELAQIEKQKENLRKLQEQFDPDSNLYKAN